MLRIYLEEIIPHIAKWEKSGLVPREIWCKMGREGCVLRFHLNMACWEAIFLFSVIALEEMTRTDHCGLDSFLHSDIVVPYIDSFGSDKQKHKYLPGCVCGDIITAVAMTEPDLGSDLSAVATSTELSLGPS